MCSAFPIYFDVSAKAIDRRSSRVRNDTRKLVKQCLNGDNSAWAELVEEYRGLVCSICVPYCDSAADVDDLVQETFVKIWANLSSFDAERGELKNWIATVARNQRVDRYRRNGQQRRTESLDSVSGEREEQGMQPLSQRIMDQRATPEEMAERGEVRSYISSAVGNVSPEMREVVRMRFLLEMDSHEIAHRLRIPEGTVKSRTSRGRAQLVQMLMPMRAALGAA